jgi:hypothetical protein
MVRSYIYWTHGYVNTIESNFMHGKLFKSLWYRSTTYEYNHVLADNLTQRIKHIDILYTLDSASNCSAIQKLKPWLQTQDIPIKWEDSYVFYFLNRELKH